MKRNLIIVVNDDAFFLSHRLRIAERAKEEGWEVTILTKDTGKGGLIKSNGFGFKALPINPTGLNLYQELKLLKFFIRFFKQHQSSVVHFVGIKNILWGGMATKFSHTKGNLFAVSGLGTLFGENKSGFVSSLVIKLLKKGMKGTNNAVIFQNHEDEDLFMKEGISESLKTYFIKGSGVRLEKYKKKTRPESSKVRIIFTGRLIKEKGVLDLIEAAEILRKKYIHRIEILICGDVCAHPESVTREEMQLKCDGRYIKWLGYREDIPELLAESDIMCYPSYYREGVPKALLEASASSLPIVTTDSVGCRDTVEEGKNGFLVPPHSPEKLAEALEKLIKDKDLREKMGKYSRLKAEREYNVEKVADKHLEIYQSLI